jgi:hypothetical protein
MTASVPPTTPSKQLCRTSRCCRRPSEIMLIRASTGGTTTSRAPGSATRPGPIASRLLHCTLPRERVRLPARRIQCSQPGSRHCGPTLLVYKEPAALEADACSVLSSHESLLTYLISYLAASAARLPFFTLPFHNVHKIASFSTASLDLLRRGASLDTAMSLLSLITSPQLAKSAIG